MSTLLSVLNCKCPNCSKGKVYKKHHFFSFAKMNDKCVNCNLLFEKEPGFFFGAMFVSYALVVAECVAVFVASGVLFFDNWFSYYLIPILLLSVAVFAPFNYRLSRVIWIALFVDKNTTSETELN
jgi:uncharacterized protein (DUF983 family)